MTRWESSPPWCSDPYLTMLITMLNIQLVWILRAINIIILCGFILLLIRQDVCWRLSAPFCCYRTVNKPVTTDVLPIQIYYIIKAIKTKRFRFINRKERLGSIICCRFNYLHGYKNFCCQCIWSMFWLSVCFLIQNTPLYFANEAERCWNLIQNRIC